MTEEALKEIETMRENLRKLSGSRGLGEEEVSLRYGKGSDGWGTRGFSNFKKDMRNSLKRIERYLTAKA